MGCAMSANANGNGNLRSEDNQANIVRKPTPWGFANGPISKTQLQEMRNEFWHNVARVGGRPFIDYIDRVSNKFVIPEDLSGDQYGSFGIQMDQGETLNESNNSENQIGTNRRDTSTFGAVHSIGSDLTFIVLNNFEGAWDRKQFWENHCKEGKGFIPGNFVDLVLRVIPKSNVFLFVPVLHLCIVAVE
ncbi:hypothetical protein Tco_0836910 [Tanacetum coccineum]